MLACLQTDKRYKSLFYPRQHALKRILMAFSNERSLRTWQSKVREKVVPTHGWHIGSRTKQCAFYWVYFSLSLISPWFTYSSLLHHFPGPLTGLQISFLAGLLHELAGNSFQMFYCPPDDEENICLKFLSLAEDSLSSCFFPVWVNENPTSSSSLHKPRVSSLKFSPYLFPWSLLLAPRTPLTAGW